MPGSGNGLADPCQRQAGRKLADSQPDSGDVLNDSQPDKHAAYNPTRVTAVLQKNRRAAGRLTATTAPDSQEKKARPQASNRRQDNADR